LAVGGVAVVGDGVVGSAQGDGAVGVEQEGPAAFVDAVVATLSLITALAGEA
jgi:hypothetical protein